MAFMEQAAPSASQAIDEAREVWERGYRDAQAAGREIPVVDVPRELGDAARLSVEATSGLARMGNRRSYTINFDLREMEERRAAKTARQLAQATPQLLAIANEQQRRNKRRRTKSAKRG